MCSEQHQHGHANKICRIDVEQVSGPKRCRHHALIDNQRNEDVPRVLFIELPKDMHLLDLRAVMSQRGACRSGLPCAAAGARRSGQSGRVAVPRRSGGTRQSSTLCSSDALSDSRSFEVLVGSAMAVAAPIARASAQIRTRMDASALTYHEAGQTDRHPICSRIVIAELGPAISFSLALPFPPKRDGRDNPRRLWRLARP